MATGAATGGAEMNIDVVDADIFVKQLHQSQGGFHIAVLRRQIRRRPAQCVFKPADFVFRGARLQQDHIALYGCQRGGDCIWRRVIPRRSPGYADIRSGPRRPKHGGGFFQSVRQGGNGNGADRAGGSFRADQIRQITRRDNQIGIDCFAEQPDAFHQTTLPRIADVANGRPTRRQHGCKA